MTDYEEFTSAFHAQAAALRGVAGGLTDSLQDAPPEFLPGLKLAINVIEKCADKVLEEAANL